MNLPRGIRRRIFAAFAVLIGILGVASVAALHAHEEVHGLLEEVASAEEGIEAALRLSAAVRDQYAHQAHTVLLNDRSHLGHYAESQRAVAEALAASRSHVRGAADRAALDEIEKTAAALDENFQREILPRIPGDPKSLAAPHDTALRLVMKVVAIADELGDRLSAQVEKARKQADAARREAVWRTFVILGSGLAFAAGVGLFIDRSITGPLRNLDEGARQLATGDLSVRIPVDRDDELGSLAERFNSMAADLSRRQEQLVQSEKLAGVGRLAAGVAHEINNPLAVILGYARLIARSKDEGAAADAKVIAEEVERCQEIVTGLLDLTRRPRLAKVSVDLASLVAEVAERLDEPGIAPKVCVHGDAQIEGDAGKLRQILANLLRNASDAAPGRPIAVEILASGDEVRLRVTDEGEGVSSESRSRLFEPFFTTKPKGTGLGLAVSAALAESHGGSLELVDGPGPGATFELTLPVRAQHPEERAA